MLSFPHLRLQKFDRIRLVLYGLTALIIFGLLYHKGYITQKNQRHISVKLLGFEQYVHGEIIEDPPIISIDMNGKHQIQYCQVPESEFDETIYRISMIQAENDRTYIVKPSQNITLQSLVNLIDRLSEISDRVQNDWAQKSGHPGGRIIPIIRFPPIPDPPSPKDASPSGLTFRSTRTLPLRGNVRDNCLDFSSPSFRAASAAPVSFPR